MLLSFVPLCLWAVGALGETAAENEAETAADTFSLFSNAALVSVGDRVTVTYRMNLGLGLPGAFQYTYDIPDAARYVPDSFRWNGSPIPDSDPRLTVGSRSVTLSLLAVPGETTTLTLTVRATGSIGDAIHHEARISGVIPTRTLRARPSRIEDETAALIVPDLVGDAVLDEANDNWNYGRSPELGTSNASGQKRHSLMRFDLASLPASLPPGWEVQKARLELYPEGIQGSGILELRPVLQNWTEGIMEGAPCLGGATWITSNCADSWAGGGKLDKKIDDIAVNTSSTYLELDVTEYVRKWLDSGNPEYGFALRNDNSTLELVLASREGARDSTLSPRLIVVAAPAGNYNVPAASNVRAEIIPTEVIAGIGSRSFEYWLLPDIRFDDTGINRVSISIPAEYTLTSVDSLSIGSATYHRGNGTLLDPFEFESWSTASRVDIRFYPTLTWLDGNAPIRVVFHAVPPGVSTADREFRSTVDHDRRGQPIMNASEGDANPADPPGDNDRWKVRATSTDLVRVDVSPADTSVAQGYAVAYHAVAVYADSSRFEVSEQATWSVAPDSLGVFDDAGVLQTLTPGSGQVSASWHDVPSAPAALIVSAAELVSLQVDPTGQSIAVGASASFRATGVFSSGDSLDVTDMAAWSVMDTVRARMVAPGLALGLTTGSTSVSAVFSGFVAKGLLTVTPAELVQIDLSPADTSVALGFDVQLSAIGQYTDGSTADITSIVNWNSVPQGIVDIGAEGLATTLAQGITSISASRSDVTSAPTTFAVTAPVLLELDGSPDAATVTVQSYLAVQSWGTYSNGDVVNKTPSVTWTSLDPAIADFVAPGTVTALAPGTARLTHALESLVGDTLTVTVTPATVESLQVVPASLVLPPGTQYALQATGFWNDGSSQNVTGQSIWSSSDAGIADIDSTGRINAVSEGVTLLSASFGGVSDACSLLVSITAFDSLAIQPAGSSVPVGLDAPHQAIAYRNGTGLDVTTSATWNTSNALVAQVDSAGVVTGIAPGSATLYASIGLLQAAPVPLQILDPVIVAVGVQPESSTLRLGTSKQLSAWATRSDGQQLDVTGSASWSSSSPGILYVQEDGVALGLSLGSSAVTASFDGLDSPASQLVVLPSVELETPPIGSLTASPSQRDVLLLSTRLINHDVQSHLLSALRVDVIGPTDTLRLWLDDGNGIFDPAADLLTASGDAAAGRWTATNLGTSIPVGGSRIVHLSADVSATHAVHGDTLDAFVGGDADLFWDGPTATVAPGGFPLDSFGEVTAQDLVVSQLPFVVQAADTIFPGSQQVPLLQFTLPDDGGVSDALTRITVHQVGSAEATLDLARLRLQTEAGTTPQEFPGLPGKADRGSVDPTASGWLDAADLVHTGAGQWVASGLSISVPAGGMGLRVIAQVATSAREGRSLQLELPPSSLSFASGRSGPVDAGWTNPNSVFIEAQHQLGVEQTLVIAPDNPISRQADKQVVLGLELTAWTAEDDELTRLTLNHTSIGPTGSAADRDAQIQWAQLWWDVDASGDVSVDDQLLDTQIPGSPVPGEIRFGGAAGLGFPLPVAEPMPLLVTLTPHPTRVRDAELLRVLLASPSQVETQGGLEVLLPAPLQTLTPPQVDGQELDGYDVRNLQGAVLLAKSTDELVLDWMLPSNGVDDDVLESLRLENLGSATTTDIGGVHLWRDDGNETFDGNDSLVVTLSSVESRAWAASGIGLPLPAADPRRFWISLDIATNAVSGQTFQASIPLDGVQVTSGNDGPVDAVLVGGEPNVISVQNKVTWLAGVVGSQTIPPDASDQVVLILEGFNGYSSTRTLQSLEVSVRGTAAEQEFELWRLHADDNGNGILDSGDTNLAIASIENNLATFSGFAWDMPSQEQKRLLVSYSLSAPAARDASTIDAVIASRNSFDYAQGTQSTGSFELDSPGIDTIDGMIRNQITNIAVPQRTLGGGETTVLSLDLLLPSNGWQSDTLQSLQVQLATTPPAAAYGSDVLDVELWQESSGSPVGASFDPAADIYLQRAVQNGSGLLFSNLSAIVPPGGRRFYVTVDVSASPADSVHIQLILPRNGVTMRSGNDGPLDEGVLDTAVHTVSSSDLLASIDVAPLFVSRGQQVAVNVLVRNQGSAVLDSVYVDQLLVDPPGAASLVNGPTPTFVTLAPQAEASIDYVYSMDVTGDVRFEVIAREWNGSQQSDPSQSASIHVESPPSALELSPLSTLPPSVNRGQISVTPLIWQLSHPDTDSLAADISIDTVSLQVQTGTGTPLPASSVLSSLEIRTGGLVHALWSTIPADTLLSIPLDIPVVLTAGEERDLPLTVSIASDAGASSFRLHLQGGAVLATDANNGQPVPLVADLPWSTQSANILTPATSIEMIATRTLPESFNAGQSDVPGGALTFVLPGAPGESEARITQLALDFEENGAAVLAQNLFSRVRVRHGTTTLLDLQDMQSETATLDLPLAIPKVVASGDSVRLELTFDTLNGLGVSELEVVLKDSTRVQVRDSNSGVPVPVTLVGAAFPWKQGPASVQSPAQLLQAQATPTAPTGTFPAAQQMSLMDLLLVNQDPPGAAAMRIESLSFEVLDELGNALIPTSVVATARLLQNTDVIAQTTLAVGQRMTLTPATALLLAPGDSLRLSLQADLSASLAEPWVRFHLPGGALSVHDANDTNLSISADGLPASTALIQIVAEASAVAMGPLANPQANLVPGVLEEELLPLRLEHPGAENEADIQAQSLVVKLRDAASQSLPVTDLLATASLAWDTLSVAGVLAGDSLTFDLSSITPLPPGGTRDLSLQIEVDPLTRVGDFRIALENNALRAISGGGLPLTVQPTGPLGLPWLSPTIHVSAGTLEESFASYPNPFLPAQGGCHITFFLPQDARVTCDIHSLSGERVVRLLDAQPRPSGMHDDLTWDGRNENGDLVRNGTYLLRIQVSGAGGGEFYRKLAVIR